METPIATQYYCVSVFVQIFIDRDPNTFEPILHYLRTKEVKLR